MDKNIITNLFHEISRDVLVYPPVALDESRQVASFAQLQDEVQAALCLTDGEGQRDPNGEQGLPARHSTKRSG